jgi:hypothetical protein
MKNNYIIFTLLLLSTFTYSQKSEKLKGSKIVSVTHREIGAFENIEVEDNIDIFLVKGNDTALEIEADDNTHEAFETNLSGNTLRIRLTKDISGAKKLSIRVTYTDNLKMLIAKTDANVTALSELNLSNITFKCYDNSRLFLNANSKNFTLIANDKSKVEMNLKSEDVVLELNKNTTIKALITTAKLKCDMYQKSSATIEGDVEDFKLRMDNNTNFTGKNLTTNLASLIMEGNAKSGIQVKTRLTLEAAGRSETFLYGDAKIDVKRFSDEATIFKRTLK